MNRRRYQAVYRWFTARPRALTALRAADKLLALLVYAAYPLLLLWLAVHRDTRIFRAVLVPAAVFVAGTALRAALNRPRPTAVLGLPPLLNKEKQGESFPSRHVLSAAVIAAVFFYAVPPLGPVLAAITLLIALVRVIGGVHFVKDVTAGALLGGALGWLGCFVL